MSKYPQDKTFEQLREQFKDRIDLHTNVENLYILDVKKASEIQDRPQLWFWDSFIPLETCTLIAGIPGIGKSQFLMWLTSAASQGLEFILNAVTYKIEKSSVLIIACEDSEDMAIVPRLKALNADLDKIGILRCSMSRNDSAKRKLIALDTDLEMIEEYIKLNPDLRLMIIDPISGFSGRTRDHIDCEVRNLLNKLNELATKYKIAIVLNKHLRKPKGDGISAAINEVAGSGAWVAVIRQSFVIAPHHEDPSIVLFSNLKVNLNKKATESFGYRIESHSYTSNLNQEIHTSRLNWMSGTYKINADEAVNKKEYDDKSKTQQVKKYLFDRLINGSQQSKKLIQDCINTFDVTDKIIYRIKSELKIGSAGSTRGGTCWFLTPESPDKI